MSFHDRPNLRCQRAQELTRSLLFARIRRRQRGDEIDMGVGVRFAFVESQMDHGWGCSGSRRAHSRLVRDSGLERKMSRRDRDETRVLLNYCSGGAETRFSASFGLPLSPESYLIAFPHRFLTSKSYTIISDPNARLPPIVYSLARSCEGEDITARHNETRSSHLWWRQRRHERRRARGRQSRHSQVRRLFFSWAE